MTARRDSVSGLIAAINSIGVGELGAIESKLQAVKSGLGGIDAPDVSQAVAEAEACLKRLDLENFRRLLAQAVAKLGHLR